METQSEWREIFCGRQHELAELEAAYLRVVEGAGPELVVVLGDRGMGKTRLVQELYRSLTTCHDPDNYWPDASLFKGDNLRVAPDLAEPRTRAHFSEVRVDQRRMPFLWWGIRIADPLDRNAIQADLATHRRTLDPHLGSLVHARRLAEADAKLKGTALETGKAIATKLFEMVPVVGPAAALAIEGGGMLAAGARARRERAELRGFQAQIDVAGVDELASADLLSQTVDDLCQILAGSAGGNRTPVVVFCDDAQFARAGGDEGALRLLLELWDRAEGNRWPLLLVATHWAVDWAHDAATEGLTFARAFSRVALGRGAGSLLELGPEPALADLAKAGLDGLEADDLELLLAKADGNPQLLIELVQLTRRSPAWRRETGALTPHGRKQVRVHAGDLKQLILERLNSEVTPADVRIAVALASLQGMRFVCELTRVTAVALELPAERSSLHAAENPHRLVSGVEDGIAHFVQRAYQEAGEALLGTHVGDPTEARAATLAAALSLMDDGERWSRLSRPEQLALLGAFVALGEEAPDPELIRRVGEALLILIHAALHEAPGSDYARAAQLARRFEAGLNRRFRAEDYPAERLREALFSLWIWYGDTAGEALARSALDAARRAVAEEPSVQARLDLLMATGNLASTQIAANHFSEGERLCYESITLARALAREQRTARTIRLLCASLEQLAVIARQAGRWFEVEAIHLEVLGLLRELVEKHGVESSQVAMASCLHTLGKVSQETGRWAEAGQRYRESLDVSRQLLRQSNSPYVGRMVLAGLNGLAEILEHESNDSPHALYREALAVARELTDEWDTPQTRQDLATALLKVGDIALAEGNLDEAEQALGESVQTSRRLAQNPGAADDRRTLAVALVKQAAAIAAKARPAQAEASYREGLDLCRKLAAERGTPSDRSDLATTLLKLGLFLHEQGRQAEARDVLDECVEVQRGIAETLGTVEARRRLALSLASAARLAIAQDPPRARPLLEESLMLGRALSSEVDSPVLDRDVAVALSMLTKLARDAGKKDEADAWQRDSLDWFRRIAEKWPSEAALVDEGRASLQVAKAAEEAARLEEAEALYRENLDVQRRLAELRRTPAARHALQTATEHLARVVWERGDLAGGEALLQEALELARTLARDVADPGADYNLLAAIMNAGIAANGLRNWTIAERLHDEALELATRLARELGTPGAERELVRVRARVEMLGREKRDWLALVGLHEELVTDHAQRELPDRGTCIRKVAGTVEGGSGDSSCRMTRRFEELCALSREQRTRSMAHARVSLRAKNLLAAVLFASEPSGGLDRLLALWTECLTEGNALVAKDPSELGARSLMLDTLEEMAGELERRKAEGDLDRTHSAWESMVSLSAQILRLDPAYPRAMERFARALDRMLVAISRDISKNATEDHAVVSAAHAQRLCRLLDACDPLENGASLSADARSVLARLMCASLALREAERAAGDVNEARLRRCLAILDELAETHPGVYSFVEPARLQLREALALPAGG